MNNKEFESALDEDFMAESYRLLKIYLSLRNKCYSCVNFLKYENIEDAMIED